ncbi:MAG TPA: SGNH hydrolase domain-containing protein [Burkholderiales bacterium]
MILWHVFGPRAGYAGVDHSAGRTSRGRDTPPRTDARTATSRALVHKQREAGRVRCPPQGIDTKSAAARALLRSIAANYRNVEYIEPADFFCDAETCPVIKDGYALY